MFTLHNYSSAKLVRLRTGGTIAKLTQAEEEAELKDAVAKLNESGEKYIVIGRGTNILFANDYDGTVLVVGKQTKTLAGRMMSSVAADARLFGLTGLEFAANIPGTVGGAIYCNASAHGKSMSDILISVTSVDAKGNEITRSKDECKFSKGRSIFTDNNEIIINARMDMKESTSEKVQKLMDQYKADDEKRMPMSANTCGQFFKNPAEGPAWKFIEECGLKGTRIGGAAVCEQHANFIINDNSATADDIIQLMKKVQNTVFEQKGIRLEPAVKIIW